MDKKLLIEIVILVLTAAAAFCTGLLVGNRNGNDVNSKENSKLKDERQKLEKEKAEIQSYKNARADLDGRSNKELLQDLYLSVERLIQTDGAISKNLHSTGSAVSSMQNSIESLGKKVAELEEKINLPEDDDKFEL